MREAVRQATGGHNLLESDRLGVGGRRWLVAHDGKARLESGLSDRQVKMIGGDNGDKVDRIGPFELTFEHCLIGGGGALRVKFVRLTSGAGTLGRLRECT